MLYACNVHKLPSTKGSDKARNGTEWNRNWCTIRMWMPDVRWKNCVNMSAHQYTESSSCVLYQPRRWDKHPEDGISIQQRATPSVLNILAIYLVSSVVANPSLTSEGLAMSLLSLGSAVVVSYADYFSHMEGKNSLVNCLPNFCSMRFENW